MNRATTSPQTLPGAAQPATPSTTGEGGYFTDYERERLKYWQVIVADMPPMTQDEIDRVAEVFRQIDAERKATP